MSTAVALEIGLRIYNPLPFRMRGDHLVLPAHQSYTFRHDGAVKLDSVTRVTKNSLGFRGPEPPRNWSDRVTVLTIGGSTTECLFLSDGKTWTDQFSRRLQRLAPDAWVNNAGFEGQSTFGHLVLLRDYVAQLHPTVAIFLVGVNDTKIGAAWRRDDELKPHNLSAAHRALTFMADHSEIAAVGENLIRMRRAYAASLSNTEVHPERLETRAIAPDRDREVVDELRAKFLPGFERRMREIAEITQRNGIVPVFVTQPALYGDVVDPATGVTLGLLKIDPNSNGHLEWIVLETYNEVTRRLSTELRVRLVDLAHEMPKDSRLFTDWIHYTNEGAVVVGNIIFDHLGSWVASLRRERH